MHGAQNFSGISFHGFVSIGLRLLSMSSEMSGTLAAALSTEGIET